MIKVELTQEECELFRQFQEHRNNFVILLEAGVFGLKNGRTILHFDSDGILEQIEFELVGYKRGKPLIHRLITKV